MFERAMIACPAELNVPSKTETTKTSRETYLTSKNSNANETMIPIAAMISSVVSMGSVLTEGQKPGICSLNGLISIVILY